MTIPDAFEIVSSWDVPDEDFARVVNDQAKLMALVAPEELWDSDGQN